MSHKTKSIGRDYWPYHLIINLVRMLAGGNDSVIDSCSCIITVISELGMTQWSTCLIIVYSIYSIHDTR